MDKQWYSPAEVAAIVGRAVYTVREWCRTERIVARKRPCGRGRSQEWEIHRDQIAYFCDHGLRPSPYAK